jgi:deoxyribodipyrimidine photolyase
LQKFEKVFDPRKNNFLLTSNKAKKLFLPPTMSEELEKATRRIRKSVENGELTVDDLKKAVAKKKRQVKKSNKSGKSPKRKPSAYINFSNYHRPAVKKSFPHLEVMGELARRWNALSEVEKKRWAQSRSRSPRSGKKSGQSKGSKKSPKSKAKRSKKVQRSSDDSESE